jgi:class 3 adenylate cyclase
VITDLTRRLARLGVDESQPVPEQRRTALTNSASALGAGSAFLYVVGYLVADPRKFWIGVVANIGAFVCYSSAIALNAARRWRAAPVGALVTANAHVLLVSLLLGRAVGFHYYFFIFAPIAFLLLPPSEKATLALFSLLPLGLFAWIQYGHVTPWRAIGPSVAQTLNVVAFVSTFGTLVAIVSLFALDAARWETMLATEMERSERLLLNILPASISQRLKRGDEAIADGFDEVTVLFADIVGFTELSSKLGPDEIVRVLNRIFSEFDALSEKFPVEKIKTIGDAYMVASGLPEPNPRHVRVIAELALEMRAALARVAKETGHALDVRIGVHTGPVVAGVIGTRKFIYDLWGDTVNTASRMESHGVPGAVQVTEAVRAKLGDGFVLEERGEIQVKGKGVMKTWLIRDRVTGRPPSSDPPR